MASQNPLQKLSPPVRIALGVLVLVVAAAVALMRGCDQQQQQPQPPQLLADRNIRFGTPQREPKEDPAHKDTFLVERPEYVLSYNDSKKNPNWVCWNLNKGDMGKSPARPPFKPDPLLKGKFDGVGTDEYTGTGFDRGHMCPAADRAATPESYDATFFTTNIVPQAPKCNQGGWERFESYCRELAAAGNELYIAAGPQGTGGTGANGRRDVIGRGGQINVPAAVWKVVLVLPNKDAVPGRDTRTIAVWMPNDQTVPEEWKQYRVSVADVEGRTGYKFFPLVPQDVAAEIKARVDATP